MEKIYLETGKTLSIVHNGHGHVVAEIKIEQGRKDGPFEKDFYIVFTPLELEPKDILGRYYTITKASHPNYFKRKMY